MPLQAPANPGPEYTEAYLTYTDASGNSASIVFDAVTAEDWTPVATITEHPVENGANVADHIRVGLITCTLKVRVSNEPLTDNQFASSLFSPQQMTLPVPIWVPGTGIVQVSQWQSNLDAAVAIGTVAGAIGDQISQATQGLDTSPPGNALAQKILPLIRIAQNLQGGVSAADLLDPLTVQGYPVRSLSDLATVGAVALVDSLIPSGEAVTLPVITDAGLKPPSAAPPISPQTLAFDTNGDFAAEMCLLLEGLQNSATLFTVVGSKRSTENMAIESIGEHRGPPDDTGTGVEITLSFKQLRIVQTQTATPVLPRAQAAPVEKGEQDPEDADTGASQSVLDHFVEGDVN